MGRGETARREMETGSGCLGRGLTTRPRSSILPSKHTGDFPPPPLLARPGTDRPHFHATSVVGRRHSPHTRRRIVDTRACTASGWRTCGRRGEAASRVMRLDTRCRNVTHQVHMHVSVRRRRVISATSYRYAHILHGE